MTAIVERETLLRAGDRSTATLSFPIIVHTVIPEPFGLKLPPRDITGPKSLARAVAPIYLPAFVIGIVGLVALDRHPSAIIGGLIFTAVLGLIVGVEFPLIRRNQRRRQQAQMANLPDGGIYSGPVSMFPSGGGKPKVGNILFDTLGVTFTPKNSDASSVTFGWRSVSRIRLGPVKGKIGVGRLTLTLMDGSTAAFSVPLYASMAEVLSNHQ
jgi:hypothetical protein